MRRASILRRKILAEVGFTSTEHFNYPWGEPPAAAKQKNAPSGARQVKCPADSKTGAFAPYKHFAPAKSWRRWDSLPPSILNYPWVEPPAAAKQKNAPSGASQAFSLCENLGTGAIYLSLCCEMSCGYQKEEHCKAVLFFLVEHNTQYPNS